MLISSTSFILDLIKSFLMYSVFNAKAILERMIFRTLYPKYHAFALCTLFKGTLMKLTLVIGTSVDWIVSDLTETRAPLINDRLWWSGNCSSSSSSDYGASVISLILDSLMDKPRDYILGFAYSTCSHSDNTSGLLILLSSTAIMSSHLIKFLILLSVGGGSKVKLKSASICWKTLWTVMLVGSGD